MSDKPSFRLSTGRVKYRDGISNFEARIGLGTDNQMSNSWYTMMPLSRQRQQLDAMYRSSWIVRQAVRVVADDMTRAGVIFKGVKDVSPLINAMRRTGSWKRLSETIRWARLYGGAIAVMLIDGQDMSQPLDVSRVGKGQFRGLAVLDRWVLQPSATLVGKFGPNWSHPEHYRVIAASANMPSELSDGDIHHTRVLRFEGDDLPYYQRAYEMGWGMSVVEPFHDRLVAFDSTTMGMAQMVFRAHLRTIKVDGLRKSISDGGRQYEASIQWLDMVRRYQTLEGLTVLDGKDDFSTATYGFNGLADVMMQMSQQVAGATGIPLVKLFGMSPAGFSTGESDLKSYEGNIALRQESDARQQLELLFSVLHYSELGMAPSSEFGFDYAPLSQMSAAEKATIASTRTTAIMAAEAVQVISGSQALRELQAVGRDTGTFATITDEDVAKAQQLEATEPPPAIGAAPDAEALREDESEPGHGAVAGTAPDADGDDEDPGRPPLFLQKPRLVAGAGMRGVS